MNRIAACVMALGLVASEAQAQLRVGATYGETRARYSAGGYDAGYTARSGSVVGVTVAWGLTPHISLQGEIQYLERGTLGRSARGLDMRASYLEIPLFVRAHLGPVVSGVRVTPSVGLALGREVSCGGTTMSGSLAMLGTEPRVIPLNCRSMRTGVFDVGVHAGLGVDREFGATTIRIEARYLHGLVNLAPDHGAVLGGDHGGTLENRTVQLALGLERPLRR